MKRVLSLVISAVLLASLCSCAGFKPRLKFTEAEQAGLLHSEETVREALAAFRKADPFCARPDPEKNAEFKNYRKQTVTDDEYDISIDYYYDGDKLIYADYNGYGEDAFEIHLDGGQSIVCTDDEGERVDVIFRATLGGYSVSVSPADDMDEKYYYGSKALYVTIYGEDDEDISAFSQYYVDTESGEVYLEYGRYQSADKSWYTYYFDLETGGTSDLLYEKLADGTQPSIAGESSLPKNTSAIGAEAVQIELGMGHRFCFTEDEKGEKQWYLKAPFYAFFNNKDKCDKFLRSHPNGEEGTTFGDDDNTLYYWKATSLLPISESTTVDDERYALDLIDMEFNDPVEYYVTLDENGHISSLERSPITAW